ncbi:MAG TPA: DegT/DnrJ/EryC1/StrS family aminotransferase [Bacteroidales bacterium]|nr:DegT/DnrJ/EryC1/StrS family aminotransferase [Bacteroidales bacterium]
MSQFIPVSEPSITQKEVDYVADAVKSGWVSSHGEYLLEFEERFADFIGTRYAVSNCNGTVALHLALLVLGIKSGDEVIVPDLTFVATANAVSYTGAKPVFVDIERNSWCIDPCDIERAITEKTKAIIPVHLYGHPANMDDIVAIAKKHSLYIIEDCAEAHGAEYKGIKVGSFGDLSAFSFYGNKVITTGEGGMITTDNEEYYRKAKYLRDHAMSEEKRYWHTDIGYNYRMTNIQAALGVAQLERIQEILEKKRQIFEWYHKCLSNVSDIVLNPETSWAKNIFWMVSIVLTHATNNKRDDLMLKLKNDGIETRPFFYPLSDMPMYTTHRKTDTSVAHYISERGINLPSSAKLTFEDVEYVCGKIKEWKSSTL